MQVVGVAADASGPVAAGDEVAQVAHDCLDGLARRVEDEPRHHAIAGNDLAEYGEADGRQLSFSLIERRHRPVVSRAQQRHPGDTLPSPP